MRSEAVRSVIGAYDDWIVRGYCWGRFGILRQRFLDEIGQYLPARGRIAMARVAATRLGLANARYEVGDARDFRSGEKFDAAYMLDIVHHVPAEAVPPLLEQLAKVLPPGGRLVIKDVDSRPAYKRWFTHALDRVMDPRSPVRYWSGDELQPLIEGVGFRVYRHLMVDFLPYPHVLYICERLP
jgi:SAM-dependent methyltransferase